MEYSYKISEKGNISWYIDGKRVEKKAMPIKERRKILKKIDKTRDMKTLDIQEQGGYEQEYPKICIFCGKYPTHIRGVMIGQKRTEVKLCESCYYEKTLGSIVKELMKGE